MEKKKVINKKNEMKRNEKCEFLLLKFTLDLFDFGIKLRENEFFVSQ